MTPTCPYHDPLDECCADPGGWHNWRGDACDNCGQVKQPHNPCDTASITDGELAKLRAKIAALIDDPWHPQSVNTSHDVVLVSDLRAALGMPSHAE